MQTKNLIVFAVLAVLSVGLWYWFLAPTGTGDKDDADKDKKQLAKNKDEGAKDKGTDKDKDKEKDKGKDKDKDKGDKPPEKKPEKKEQPPEKIEPKAIAKDEPAKQETLGGKGFHLTVDLTERGAGVRRLVLNHFKAADWRGRPTDRDLELIQDDEYSPSYRMYHYVHSDDKNPVLGLGDKIWKLEGKAKNGDTEEVRFSTTIPELDHIKIVKIYRLAPKEYHVTMLLEIHDLRTDVKDKQFDFRYQLTGAQGLPVEGEWYATTFRNAFIGLVDPSGRLSRKLEESIRISGHKGGDKFPGGNLGDARLQYAGVANQYFGAMICVDNVQPDKRDGGVAVSDVLAWARPTLETSEKRGFYRKVIGKNKDLLLFAEEKSDAHEYILLPRTKEHIDELELEEGDKVVLSSYTTPDGKNVATWIRPGNAPRPQFDDITVRVMSLPVPLTPGNVVKHQFLLYHGPVKAALLGQATGDKEVPAATVERYTHTLNLRTLTDYPSDNWFGAFSNAIWLTDLIIQFTRLMHWLLNFLHTETFGYGPAIIILTVIVRGAMFPISRKQALFSIKMQELAPELKKIQDKYPDDPQAKMQATQEFYRKHGINPLGSCWPVFLQMPIFLGLYFALQESVNFRLASFLWIENLAAPDMLIWWTEQIPYLSNPDNLGGMLYLGPYLNILPMIAVVFMMIQQMQTMPPPTDDQQAMQQKMLKFMTIFFGLMFYKVAAGLCIYFTASSLWGMAERKLLPKKKTGPGVPSTSTSAQAASSTSLGPKDKWKSAKKDKEKNKEKSREPVTAIEKLKALWREILKQAEKK